MSFYGSVYYQLVDTFYKIVAKNSTARNFGPVEYPTEDLETQAIGRKGILSLNAGNKWIGFDQIRDAQGDPTGQGYMIYHAPADNDPTSATRHGFSCQDDLEMDEDGVYQLTEDSVFETNSYLVDAAGHIIPDVSVKYKLPKTETTDRLNALESWKDQLFWLINGTMPDQPIEDMDAFIAENPREENHADRISAGEEYDEIVRQIYTKSDYFGDSAEETAKVFFGEDDWSDDKGKARSFVDAFGSIRDIKEEVFGGEYAEDHSEDYTVAEAIIKIKGEVDKNADNIETNLQSATQTHVQINNDLADHDNRINNIVKMYGKTNSENSEDPEVVRKFTSEHYFGRNALDDNGIYRNFIDGFGSIDQVITSVFHTNNYDSSTTVSNAIATLAGNAETLRGEFDALLKSRVGLDDKSGLSKRISTNETDIQAIKDDLGPATKEGSVRHTLVQLAAADSTLDGKITGLGARHDNELEVIRKNISDNAKAIEDEATARDEAIAQAISDEVTARDETIAQAIDTEVRERDEAITQAINSENLADLRAQVGQNITDIGAINTQLTGENGIIGQINGINGQIIGLNSNKVETSTFEAFKTANSSEIDKKLDSSTFTAFTQELNTNLESYAQKDDLESYSLKSDLENYILKSDYEAKIAAYDETIAKLLERLEALEAIHPELTPDPDPKTPENGENTEPETPKGEDEGSTTV